MRDVRWLVYHHTGAGPDRPSAAQVAAYQTGPTSHLRFPAIAYHLFVEVDGAIAVCHDLRTLCWANGDGSPTSKHDVGIFNWWTIACCFSGEDPTPAQIAAMRRVGEAMERLLGRTLERTVHRLVSRSRQGKALTECPGERYADWLTEIN